MIIGLVVLTLGALRLLSLLNGISSSFSASILIDIGLFISIFGADAIVLGSLFSQLKKDVFWSNEEIKTERENYIFRAPDEGCLFLHFEKGDRFGKTRFRADIYEYIPYSISNAQTKRVFHADITETGTLSEKMYEGEYLFRLQNTQGHLKTGSTFSLELSRVVKPLSQIDSVGLTFIEIGIPLFISGVILLMNSVS